MHHKLRSPNNYGVLIALITLLVTYLVYQIAPSRHVTTVGRNVLLLLVVLVGVLLIAGLIVLAIQRMRRHKVSSSLLLIVVAALGLLLVGNLLPHLSSPDWHAHVGWSGFRWALVALLLAGNLVLAWYLGRRPGAVRSGKRGASASNDQVAKALAKIGS